MIKQTISSLEEILCFENKDWSENFTIWFVLFDPWINQFNIHYFVLKPVEAVRKSSLATNEKKRKTSFVSFKEEDTTIEFNEESGNEDIFLWNCMNDLFPPIVSDVNQSEVDTKGNSILSVCRVLYILSDIDQCVI